MEPSKRTSRLILSEDSQLIIFCDNKILYDQEQNNYCFAINDLNTIKPMICHIYALPKIKNKQIYM
jgi:hypothetical protein